MNILSRTLGFFALMAAAWHRALSRFHSWRMQVHSDKEDGHKAQADSLATAASALAPAKAKVIEAQVEPEPAQISPPSPARDRQALAAVVIKNFHPNRADDCA